MQKLVIHPLSLREANALVRRWHRHSSTVAGCVFCIAVCRDGDDEPCGAAIVGRPVARRLQDGWTAEIVRLVTDGTPNACTRLLGRCRRVAEALGYRRLITYTRQNEGGASLRAFNLGQPVEAGGGNWNKPGRPRVDTDDQQTKFRWELMRKEPTP